jgi:hypothetical protein
MKKDHTPPEAISFLSLVELIVKQRYGSDAIADITTHVLGKGKKSRTVLKRAGKPINYIKDSKDSNRWDTAKEAIRQACNKGELTACVCRKTVKNWRFLRGIGTLSS